jgi:hypothetical protein
MDTRKKNITLRFRVNIDMRNSCVTFFGDSFGTRCINKEKMFNIFICNLFNNKNYF